MEAEKLGVLVCGRIGSGNRYVKQVLKKWGVAEVFIVHGTPPKFFYPEPGQRTDYFGATTEGITQHDEEAALRRSAAHGAALAAEWRLKGLAVQAVVPVRSEWCRRQAARRTDLHNWLWKHGVDEDEMQDSLSAMLCRERIRFHVLSYEALITDTVKELAALASRLKIETFAPVPVPAENANRKYGFGR